MGVSFVCFKEVFPVEKEGGAFPSIQILYWDTANIETPKSNSSVVYQELFSCTTDTQYRCVLLKAHCLFWEGLNRRMQKIPEVKLGRMVHKGL